MPMVQMSVSGSEVSAQGVSKHVAATVKQEML